MSGERVAMKIGELTRLADCTVKTVRF